MFCEGMQSFSRERNILKEGSNIFEIQHKVCQGNAILLKENSYFVSEHKGCRERNTFERRLKYFASKCQVCQGKAILLLEFQSFSRERNTFVR